MPSPVEWVDLARAVAMGAPRGFDHAAMHELVLVAVLGGSVRLRIGAAICPPDMLHRLLFDLDQGLVHGWRPPGQAVTLQMSAPDEATPWMSIGTLDVGSRFELNAIDLVGYFKQLRELDAPLDPPRNPGGRPARWPWPQAVMALGAHLYAQGVPEDEAPAIVFLRCWFSAKFSGESPDDKQLRQCARETLAAYRKPGS